MSRKGQSITLSLKERDKLQLEQLAREQGMLWGDRPNISRLVEAIAQRKLLIQRNNDWSNDRIQALWQAVHALTDAGQIEIAQTIAGLLLERSELARPLQAEIEQFLARAIAPWRQEIEQYVRRQQPFQLTYQDATERLLTFTIRHAKIGLYERRQYLLCWCDETAGNQDLPALQHNWTLRLDRIPNLALSPVSGHWQPNLDHVDVEIHFLNRLAIAYEPKPEDRVNEWLTERQPPARRVIRQVVNSFWCVRDLLRYGKDCVVMTPTEMRDRMAAEVQAMNQNYENL
jgi:predicted DNA-binding transcriptional regulator YafY